MRVISSLQNPSPGPQSIILEKLRLLLHHLKNSTVITAATLVSLRVIELMTIKSVQLFQGKKP